MKKTVLMSSILMGAAIAIWFSKSQPSPKSSEVSLDIVTSKAPSPKFQQREAVAIAAREEIAELPKPREGGFQRRYELYTAYAKKVLKTEAEGKLMRDLLLDEEMQRIALEQLNEKTDMNTRMMMVNFLMDGMDEEKSLDRSQVRERVAEFLKTEIPPHIKDKRMIRSLAADRIELFVALNEYEPKLAATLAATPSGELNRRIYQYALANYGKRKG